MKEDVARTYSVSCGKFAEEWHYVEVELDRGGRFARGVESAVCTRRRGGKADGMHGQTVLYKVLWLRYEVVDRPL